ncbi:hypothetical protein PGT21_026746 [Puccinia graminis f. sp. tritici]|uniref:Uncharacterized protein n=1 Tax=Puccinia graminis f. sp. tritici TaxID=56615 RepID=A0A5B0PUW3_PUCGR|nr:hypothetical protein PGT21_026746 [Puccinia graminis f. sp. tritici]
MYLVDWKGFLPAGEVHVPRRVEGKPSTRRGTCLAGWKETFPAGEDVPRRLEEPRRLEGNPSSRPLAPGIPWDTRISARFGGGKRPSAAESAPPGGYPLGPAGIRQRITDIRSGLSATISSLQSETTLWKANTRFTPKSLCFSDMFRVLRPPSSLSPLLPRTPLLLGIPHSSPFLLPAMSSAVTPSDSACHPSNACRSKYSSGRS